ncbi:hypothetical protein ACP4OV_030420 [Aristida adscensionis]
MVLYVALSEFLEIFERENRFLGVGYFYPWNCEAGAIYSPSIVGRLPNVGCRRVSCNSSNAGVRPFSPISRTTSCHFLCKEEKATSESIRSRVCYFIFSEEIFLQMKIVVLVVLVLVFINPCRCIQNDIGDGMYKDTHEMEMRRLSNIDGRTAPTGDAIDHVCPLGSYPCRPMDQNPQKSLQDVGGH